MHLYADTDVQVQVHVHVDLYACFASIHRLQLAPPHTPDDFHQGLKLGFDVQFYHNKMVGWWTGKILRLPNQGTDTYRVVADGYEDMGDSFQHEIAPPYIRPDWRYQNGEFGWQYQWCGPPVLPPPINPTAQTPLPDSMSGEVRLSWSAPVAPDGCTLDGYEIFVNDEPSPRPVDDRSSQADFLLGDLPVGGLVSLQICSVGTYARQPLKSLRVSFPLAIPRPVLPILPPPSSPFAKEASSSEMQLSWSAPVAPDGCTLDGYEIFVNDEPSPRPVDDRSSQADFLLGDLPVGGLVSLQICSVGTYARQPLKSLRVQLSDEPLQLPPPTPPSPINFNVEVSEPTSVTLKWLAPVLPQIYDVASPVWYDITVISQMTDGKRVHRETAELGKDTDVIITENGEIKKLVSEGLYATVPCTVEIKAVALFNRQPVRSAPVLRELPRPQPVLNLPASFTAEAASSTGPTAALFRWDRPDLPYDQLHGVEFHFYVAAEGSLPDFDADFHFFTYSQDEVLIGSGLPPNCPLDVYLQMCATFEGDAKLSSSPLKCSAPLILRLPDLPAPRNLISYQIGSIIQLMWLTDSLPDDNPERKGYQLKNFELWCTVNGEETCISDNIENTKNDFKFSLDALPPNAIGQQCEFHVSAAGRTCIQPCLIPQLSHLFEDVDILSKRRSYVLQIQQLAPPPPVPLSRLPPPEVLKVARKSPTSVTLEWTPLVIPQGQSSHIAHHGYNLYTSINGGDWDSTSLDMTKSTHVCESFPRGSALRFQIEASGSVDGVNQTSSRVDFPPCKLDDAAIESINTTVTRGRSERDRELRISCQPIGVVGCKVLAIILSIWKQEWEEVGEATECQEAAGGVWSLSYPFEGNSNVVQHLRLQAVTDINGLEKEVNFRVAFTTDEHSAGDSDACKSFIAPHGFGTPRNKDAGHVTGASCFMELPGGVIIHTDDIATTGDGSREIQLVNYNGIWHNGACEMPAPKAKSLMPVQYDGAARCWMQLLVARSKGAEEWAPCETIFQANMQSGSIEARGLRQCSTYKFCWCVIIEQDRKPPLFLFTAASERQKTWAGDVCDFYDPSDRTRLGEGSFARVQPGWYRDTEQEGALAYSDSAPCAVKVWLVEKFEGDDDMKLAAAKKDWEFEQKALLAASKKAVQGKDSLLQVLHRRSARCEAAEDADDDTPTYIKRYPSYLLVIQRCKSELCRIFCSHPEEMNDMHRNAFKQLITLFEELHANKGPDNNVIIHRDVDQSNILVVEEEDASGKKVQRWKLADFGLSRMSGPAGLKHTKTTGHPRTQDVRLVAQSSSDTEHIPQARNDVVSLAILFHQFVSAGQHFLFGPLASLDFLKNESRKYYDLPGHRQRQRLLELRYMPRPRHLGMDPPYSDAHDLFLYMADDRNQCSLVQAQKHPFLMDARRVREFLTYVRESILDRPETAELQDCLELRRDSAANKKRQQIVEVISCFPHGLRELAGRPTDEYLKLLTSPSRADRSEPNPDHGWAGELPGHFCCNWNANSSIYPKWRDPKHRGFFSVCTLLRTLHNFFKHAKDFHLEGTTYEKDVPGAGRRRLEDLLQGKSSDEYLAGLIRSKYPFLLSHVFHVLQHFKDDETMMKGFKESNIL